MNKLFYNVLTVLFGVLFLVLSTLPIYVYNNFGFRPGAGLFLKIWVVYAYLILIIVALIVFKVINHFKNKNI